MASVFKDLSVRKNAKEDNVNFKKTTIMIKIQEFQKLQGRSKYSVRRKIYIIIKYEGNFLCYILFK